MMVRIRERVAAWPAVAVDTGVAVLAASLGLAVLWSIDPALSSVPGFVGPDLTGVVVILAATVPLVVRRRFPTVVLATITAVEAVAVPLEVHSNGTGLVVAFYSTAAYCSRRRSLAGLVLVLVAYGSAHHQRLTLLYLLGLMIVLTVTWVLGDTQRTRRAYTAELTHQAAVLQREHEQQARLAAAEERVRIARELHDVLAHQVSVMGIQAAAARRVFNRRPDDAAAALASIETLSRQAMGELHRLVGLLRHKDEDDALGPRPGLDRLPALVAGMSEAGLPVDLQIQGNPRALPAAVELSAFRIVQEALTNTLKHAGPARAWVTIHYDDGGVELEVADDGRGPSPAQGSGGNGLVGMRERVSLHGGYLYAGARPGGGFRVQAVLNGQVP